MATRGAQIPLEQYFAGAGAGADARSGELFAVVRAAIESVGPSELRVTKSQIEFRHSGGFAWVWLPAQYLRGTVAPLVLTIKLSRRDASPRWKEVVEPRRGRFIHHLELQSCEDVDEEVLNWLREAWGQAG